MILVIDNYDSFTYNIVQYIGEENSDIVVVRNDEIAPEKVLSMNPSRIVISPGPGRPEDSGICPDVIRRCGGDIPILGICLGHQAIAYVFGGTVTGADRLLHGKTSDITHDGRTIFSGLENPLRGTRYHSLVVERDSLPDCLEITAEADDGAVMGIRHREFPVEGVQFHPESILTSGGKALLRSFLRSDRGIQQ